MADRARYYSLFWRWHFYAGLIVAPFALILAITGGIYLFQPEIEHGLYKDRLYIAQPHTGTVNHDAVIQAARTALNAKQIHSYQPPRDSLSSAQVVLTTEEGVKYTAYVHPGTHALLGTVNEQWRLTGIAREIHKNLTLGTPGRVITELAACWLIVMIITGLYLWWPRGDKARGALVPNTKAKGRTLWREFHAVPGAIASLWILALLFTGLPWSLVWGGLLSDFSNRADEGFPKAIFSARPVSSSSETLPEISMNRLMRQVEKQNIQHAYKIEYPWWKNGSYALTPLRHGGSSEDIAYLFFDRRNGTLLADYRFEDLGKVGRLTALGIAFHEGRLFGRPNQLLNLVAVTTVIGMCITGPILWWKRRPKGSLAAPRVAPGIIVSRPLLVAIALIGILLPLFGASVLLILLGETILRRLRKRHVAF